MSSVIARIVSWICAAAIGAAFGAAGTFAHGIMLGPIPVGLILSGIACVAIVIAVRTLSMDRWMAVATGLGIIAIVMVLAQRGPGGSVVVPNTLLGQIWLGLAGLIVLVAATWPDTKAMRAARLADREA